MRHLNATVQLSSDLKRTIHMHKSSKTKVPKDGTFQLSLQFITDKINMKL